MNDILKDLMRVQLRLQCHIGQMDERAYSDLRKSIVEEFAHRLAKNFVTKEFFEGTEYMAYKLDAYVLTPSELDAVISKAKQQGLSDSRRFMRYPE